MREVYCDYAATTPLDVGVKEEMKRYYEEEWGNASALHARGKRAAKVLYEAKKRVARVLGVGEGEVVFTSGGTESDNLALVGVMEGLMKGRRVGGKRHLMVSAVEHAAVLKAADYLEWRGFEVTRIPVDGEGRVDLKFIGKKIKKNTALVSVMYANNEVGTVQSLREISKICKGKGVWFHTDAVQAPGLLPLGVNKLGVDLMSFSAHKFYGPQGVGILYVREGVNLLSQNRGGGQEEGRRAGTENLAGVVGAGLALEKAEKERESEVKRLKGLRDYLQKEVLKRIKDVKVNGYGRNKLANVVHFSFAGVEGEALALKLDEAGVQVSTASACSSKSLKGSHVLAAMGLDPVLAHGSIRFSLGKGNNKKEMDYVVKVLEKVVGELREMSPIYEEGMIDKLIKK